MHEFVIMHACLFSSGNSHGHNFPEPFEVLSSLHAVRSAKTKFFEGDESLHSFLHSFAGAAIGGHMSAKQESTSNDQAKTEVLNRSSIKWHSAMQHIQIWSTQF